MFSSSSASGSSDSPLQSSNTTLLERMFQIHIQDVSRTLINWLGFISVIFIVLTRPLDYFVPAYSEGLLYWRLLVCLFLLLPIILLHFSRKLRRWTNLIFTLNFIAASVATGYFLMPFDTPNAFLRYLVYVVPLWPIVTPSNLPKRFLITSCSFFVFLGAYFSIGPQILLFLSIAVIMSGMILISVIIGHMGFYRLIREDFFNHRRLRMQHQRIERLANYDQLTGLYDRHRLEDRLTQEVSRSNRYDHNLTLMMLDLDHFKNVNDTYGHTAGDTVLEETGDIIRETCQENIRQSDIAGRYGGEEFCILLPETNYDEALRVAERIRTSLSEMTFTGSDGKEFQVTCSIGIAEYDSSMDSYEELVKAADDALYEAKESGRNQVVTDEEIPD
ncbi:MAG: GGDEF domain-containing protein [bacterium]